MSKEIPRFLINHQDGSKTYFHPDQIGKPKNTSGYREIEEKEFEKRIKESALPFDKDKLSVAAWGGVSVCLKIENPEGSFAATVRPLPPRFNFDELKYHQEIEEETKNAFKNFSIPQMKAIASSSFGVPVLLKVSRWIDNYRPSFLDILASPQLSEEVSKLSRNVLNYFIQSKRIIDLSGKINTGKLARLIPFTVINSENILFEKETQKVYLVDCGLWPKNHFFNEASNKQKLIILLRIATTGFVFTLTSLASKYHLTREKIRSFFRRW